MYSDTAQTPGKPVLPELSRPASKLAAKPGQLWGVRVHPDFCVMEDTSKPPSFANSSTYCRGGGCKAAPAIRNLPGREGGALAEFP